MTVKQPRTVVARQISECYDASMNMDLLVGFLRMPLVSIPICTIAGTLIVLLVVERLDGECEIRLRMCALGHALMGFLVLVEASTFYYFGKPHPITMGEYLKSRDLAFVIVLFATAVTVVVSSAVLWSLRMSKNGKAIAVAIVVGTVPVASAFYLMASSCPWR